MSTKNIGRYLLRQELGHGATGIVHLAYDPVLKRQVALKSLHPKFLELFDARTAFENFLGEARIAANLNHTHITAIHDMGMHKGLPFIVMELVTGLTIKQIISQQIPYTNAEKVSLLAMIARALHFAHQHGVLHRDIKPANIMVMDRHIPKITDFGIAIIMQPGSAERSKKAGILQIGTPLYMSPEQYLQQELDARTDIYSLGVLAYEWLSGTRPHQSQSGSVRLSEMVMNVSPPLASVADIDPELAAIVDRAIAKQPEDRQHSAADLSDSLELYLDRIEASQADEELGLTEDQMRVVEQMKRRYLIFSDFTSTELLGVLRSAKKVRVPQEGFLLREGTSGTRMFIILSGSVAITSGKGEKAVVLDSLGPGHCVGEMSILDGMPRSASAIATSPVVAISINETVLRTSNPRLCMKFYRNLATILSERLRLDDSRTMPLNAGKIA